MKKGAWSSEEIQILQECFAKKMMAKDISVILQRSIPAIRIKASRLGIAEPHPEIRDRAKPHRDLTGMKFGKLTALRPMGKNLYNAMLWECKCDCGNKNLPLVSEYALISGHSQSCGCSWADTCRNNFKKYNTFDLSGDVGICYVEQGKFLFDKEDYELIKDYCWRINTKGYVQTTNADSGKAMMFHRFVMGAYDDEKYNNIDIDHKDLNPLNNQKENLRFATRSQNNMNRSLQSNNTSGAAGVQKIKYKSGKIKWTAQVSVNNNKIWLGTFDNYEDAVRARRSGEQKYYKEFSYNNSAYLAKEDEQKQ